MKIIINTYLYTDGDFSLNNPEKYDITADEDCYIYTGVKTFDDSTAARKYLEDMLCDMHVCGSHWRILIQLLDMFEPLINFADDCERGTIRRYMYGNYTDTKISVAVI